MARKPYIFDQYHGPDDWDVHLLKRSTTPSRPRGDGKSTGHKETSMSAFNFPGADKFMSRLFRKADGVVWDLMSGKIGVQTDDGIATLDGEGDDARVNINLMDDFGMALPAFAQATPKDGVKVGDIIFRGQRNNIAWVISKNEDKGTFKLMKPNGETASWNPPKVTMMGFESGVMVLRSLVSMLPTGAQGLGQMQNMLMPMMLMGGMEGEGIEKMMPFLLMSQMNGASTDGNAMGGMMQAMMFASMMKGDGPMGGNKRNPFNRS